MPMGFLPKQPGPEAPAWQHWLYWGLFAVLLLSVLIGILWKSVKIVRRGHAGIKTRNGKARKCHSRAKGEACITCDSRARECETCRRGKYCRACPRCSRHDEWMSVGPGLYIVVPGTDSIETTETQDRNIELPATRFDWVEQDGSKKQYYVDGTLTCAVDDDSYSLYEAIFEPKNLEDSLTALAAVCLSKAASAASDLEDLESIATTATRMYNGDGMTYGSTAKRFLVKPIPRTGEQVLGDNMSPGLQAETAAAIGRSGGLEAVS